MTQFDRDIAVTKICEEHYSVTISETWNVIIGPNGGYIAAIILNGMKSELGNVQTRSITFHFLSASIPGDAELFVKVEKKGRSLSTCNARLVQGEKTIAVAIATFATKRSEFGFRDFEAPEVPFPEEIESSKRMNSELVSHAPFRDHYDQRLAIGKIPPEIGENGRVGGWTRFRQQRIFDDLAVVAISDSWFPGLSTRATPEPMHAPTVDHTVHFLQSLPLTDLSLDSFLLVEFTTSIANEGYLVENGNIWSQTGILIAQSRQLAVCLPR
jgi:acyl-CoA thioesterase